MFISLKFLKRIFVIFIIVITLFGIIFNVSLFWKPFYPLPYRNAIFQYSKQFEIDPYLVAAIARVESKFNKSAESPRGAVGIMQLMPDTAKWAAEQMGIKYDREKLFEPRYNIKLGCWYLANLESEFNDNLILILAAYNGGRGNVKKWVENREADGGLRNVEQIPFPETRDYVRKVLVDYERYKWIYAD